MQYLEYFLMPEAGYSGEYDRKEAHYTIKKGTIADMIHDSKLLWTYDFDKIIPTFERMNEILQVGHYGRLVEWEPIRIDIKEYNEIVRALLEIPMSRPYRVE